VGVPRREECMSIGRRMRWKQRSLSSPLSPTPNTLTPPQSLYPSLTIDVEHSNGGDRFQVLPDGVIDALDQPVKHLHGEGAW
jgi:hypothetical protein